MPDDNTKLNIADNSDTFNGNIGKIPARIAVYDNMRSIPRIVDLNYNNIPDFINETSQKTYNLSHEIGGRIPYTIIKETITFSGGSIDVKDNIKNGTVISLKIVQPEKSEQIKETGPKTIDGPPAVVPGEDKKIITDDIDKFDHKVLSDRQKKILFVILELEEAGPSTIASELGFSLSTSYRELIYLEKNKLLTSSSNGKRKLSKKGVKFLEYYSNTI